MKTLGESATLEVPSALRLADRFDCLRLSDQAGWNQTADDWEYLLGNGVGLSFRDRSGRIVATTVVVRSEQAQWISMVLVDVAFRGRGLATRLLAEALRRFPEPCRVGLDATSLGIPLYRKFGFVPSRRFFRYRREGSGSSTAGDAPFSPRRVGPDSTRTDPVIAWDRSVTGLGERPSLFRYLDSKGGRLELQTSSGRGVAWLRPGRRSTHLGPILGRGSDLAKGLVREAIRVTDGPLLADFSGEDDSFLRWVEAEGFVFEREFSRMWRPFPERTDECGRLWATAGPEHG